MCLCIEKDAYLKTGTIMQTPLLCAFSVTFSFHNEFIFSYSTACESDRTIEGIMII